jgi:CDP-diacylglycerol--serine O-phosphatidyltransferase
MKLKKHIANFITALNLACGCISLTMIINQQFKLAILFVALAAVFDFFDGFVARLFHVKSELGKQLDSLSDVVSFGVVPGFVMYYLMLFSIKDQVFSGAEILPYTAFLIPVFSAFRLAKFNIDENQTDKFIGLPTPANALFIFSLLAIQQGIAESGLFPWYNEIKSSLSQPWILLAIVILFSYLLVSPLPLMAMKFKNFKWSGNAFRFSLMLVSLVLILIFYFAAVPIIILLYFILSIIENSLKSKT